jgi:hypothetical protein
VRILIPFSPRHSGPPPSHTNTSYISYIMSPCRAHRPSSLHLASTATIPITLLPYDAFCRISFPNFRIPEQIAPSRDAFFYASKRDCGQLCVYTGPHFMKICNTFSRRTTLDAMGTTRWTPVLLAACLRERDALSLFIASSFGPFLLVIVNLRTRTHVHSDASVKHHNSTHQNISKSKPPRCLRTSRSP